MRWKTSVPEQPAPENNIFQNLRQRDSTNNSLMDRYSYGSFGARYSPGHLLPSDEKTIKRESDTTMMPRRSPQASEYTRLYESVGRQGIKNQYSSRFSTSAGSENRDEDQSYDKMLLIQEIPDECTHDMVFNLCSLYGNVLEIWLHEDFKLAVVLYESSDQVYTSQRCLDRLQLFETTLKVKIASEESTLTGMAQDGDSKDFRTNPNQRFKIPGSKNYNNMNPPSTTIHLSNLPELYDLSKLRDMFAPIAVPQNISYFSGSKTMALGNFDSVADATQVLVKFHNYNINGR